ncbi:CDK5 regulatory subunit-associated protein 2 isoform X2 [Kryptolebias marmoratus]|uniref:CDK5 regulatory subunit-associated protein 2 isoform X2 n=1 Tax=Kryptolebias marmoratus TaxID=37003 RepID=UPI000D52F4E1|nr:CDK5 regulatory subunit-associated protein 2 isoform X2 [Kryptolebias marmoratus]
MSSKGRNELCRICGGDLQGNQRRWLFGGQNKRTGPLRTPAESLRTVSLSRSSQSSPWGSTLSLGSSASLSKSQASVSSPSKGVDLLAVLTHILGQAVPRDSAVGEFVCGKCVSALERVFKFDTVISRVRVLSSERLQKLMMERDKIRQWVRHNYQHRHPRDVQTSEEDGDAEKEGYREMLKENMALSEYECWSEKWDTCPYFLRTGKRCRKGKGCEGCDSLRVSDSDYESVCGIPRHLPSQPFSPLGLSRDKSQSMPLHWQGVPSTRSSPASLAGSSRSLRASSRTESIQSLDSFDGPDPFDSPGDQAVNLLLRELRSIEGRPVSSPSGSRIPVLSRRFAGKGDGLSTPTVSRELDFREVENGQDQVDGEDGDVLTELRDDYMPLHQERTTTRVHSAVQTLRAQLDQATGRIRTLEAELKRGRGDTNGSEHLTFEDGGSFVLQSFAHSLQSRERLIQECLGLIGGLCAQRGAGTELSNKLTENLQEILSDNKVILAGCKRQLLPEAALETLRSEMTENEKNLEKEMDALRTAGRDRDRDLDTLAAVLQCNQDVIDGLREALQEKERLLKEVEKERELWRRRDGALAAVLKEKEVLIQNLQQQLEASDMKTLSSSVIGQQPSGGGAELKENGAFLCQEVTKLTAALQETQNQLQTEQESHSRAVSGLTARLGDLQQQLRETQKDRKEAERAWQNRREDGEREDRRLRDSLMKRDKLIEQLLLDAEERDRLFQELQQNL